MALSGHETGGAYWIVRSGRCSGRIFIVRRVRPASTARTRCQRFDGSVSIINADSLDANSPSIHTTACQSKIGEILSARHGVHLPLDAQ